MADFETAVEKTLEAMVTPNVNEPTKQAEIATIHNNISFNNQAMVFGAHGEASVKGASYEALPSGFGMFAPRITIDAGDEGTSITLVRSDQYDGTNVRTGTINRFLYRFLKVEAWIQYGGAGSDATNFLPGGTSDEVWVGGVDKHFAHILYTGSGNADASGGSPPDYVTEYEELESEVGGTYGDYRFRVYVDSDNGHIRMRVQDWGNGASVAAHGNAAIQFLITMMPSNKVG